MKILIITQLYPQPDDYGDNKPTKTVEYFAKEWSESGHDVVVAHCSSKFPLPFYLIPPTLKNKLAGATSNIFPPLSSRKKIYREEFGIKIYRFPMLKALPGRGYSEKIMEKQGDEICKALEKLEFIPDLVVGHFANPSTELVARISEYYHAKSSIVFHGDCNERTLERYRIKKNIKSIRAIGTRSIVEARNVKKLLDLSQEPFVCCSGVPNLALETASKICIKQDYSQGIRYLYVGSFIKRKHVDTVIRAFDKVADPLDTLTIVGGGPEEENLKSLALNCKNADRIIFTGKIARDRVLEQMKNAHVFTLVSSGEVFGMVYIEAMLQGCITIASSKGGFDGIIRSGENGFISEPGDEENLSKVYMSIKSMDKEDVNTIGNNAINTAMHFSEREVAERYLNDILCNQ
ncbi:glycosyl transferase family 1 [Drancourtella sp. An177]|nr:glycosyl transferase family 1 [Drancourtella sp. An177]